MIFRYSKWHIHYPLSEVFINHLREQKYMDVKGMRLPHPESAPLRYCACAEQQGADFQSAAKFGGTPAVRRFAGVRNVAVLMCCVAAEWHVRREMVRMRRTQAGRDRCAGDWGAERLLQLFLLTTVALFKLLPELICQPTFTVCHGAVSCYFRTSCCFSKAKLSSK